VELSGIVEEKGDRFSADLRAGVASVPEPIFDVELLAVN
jgi:hypothetical protein